MKIQMMNKIKDYFSTPATWVTILVFTFWLWGMRANVNNRLNYLEEKYEEVDSVRVQMYEIQTTLKGIQTDIERIKVNKC